MIPRAGRRVLTALCMTLVASAWAYFVSAPHQRGVAGPLDGIENLLLDLRMSSSGPAKPFEDLAIVAIDDATLAAQNPLGPGRAHLAKIVTAIAEQGAAVLALDILLLEPQSPDADQALANALAKVPSVLAAAGRFDPGQTSVGLPRTDEAFWPQPIFADAAQVGLVNLSTDARGVPRHAPVAVLTNRGLGLSFPVQAAILFTGAEPALEPGRLRMGDLVVPLDTGGQMPLRLLGPMGTVPTISAQSLLTNTAETTDLHGKIVLLGVTATGLGDRFPSPFGPDLPGVEVLAAAISQILNDAPLRRDQAVRRMDRGLAMTIALLCGLVALALPLSLGLPFATGILTTGLGLTWVAFQFDIWLNAALLLASAVPPIVIAAGLRYGHERHTARRAERTVDTFKAFQSPDLAARLTQDPDYLAIPETRTVGICFVDLTGSSTLSETLGPQATQALIKGYHDRIARISDHHGGAVLSFMGDGAMIAYGLLTDAPDLPNKALAAAHKMVASTRDLGREFDLEAPLHCRVGLHWGDAVASRLGGETHQHIALSGETVNLCNRLLDSARSHGAAVVATAAFMSRLSAPPTPVSTTIRTELLRGLTAETTVHFWSIPTEDTLGETDQGK